MKSDASVTIGVVTHNRRAYLEQALQSVFAQGSVFSQLVVVNDGSSDDTREYLRQFSDPRVSTISLPVNRGRPFARNEIVKAMNGDYLIWLDDDDVFVPGAISSQLDYLRRHPGTDIVYGNHISCDALLNPQAERVSKDVSHEQMLMTLMFEDVVPNSGALIGRHVFERIGLYDLDFPRCQDYDLWARAALAGFRFGHNNKAICYFRNHQGNLANPLNVERQSEFHCRIVTKILAETKLERIFPMFDWEGAPKQSAAHAMEIVARIFYDHGDDQSALECLEYSRDFQITDINTCMLIMVNRALGRVDSALEEACQFLVGKLPDLQGMYLPIGQKRGSYAAAEQMRMAQSAKICESST